MALNTIEEIMLVVDQLTPTILLDVEQRLGKTIDLTIRQFEAKTGPIDYKSLVAVSSPTRDTIEFLQIIREDLTAQRLDVETIQALNNLEGMPNLPSCKKLAENIAAVPILADYRPPMKSLDEFTTESIRYLRALQKEWMVPNPLPGLVPSDLEAVEREHYNHVHLPANPQAHTKERQALSSADGQLPSGVVLSYEDVPLYRRVAVVVLNLLPFPKTYQQWGWPTTGALSRFSPSRFDGLAWHPSQPVLGRMATREKSDGTITDYSKYVREGQGGPHGEVSKTAYRVRVQNNVLAYLKRITTSRTPEEEAFFESICRSLSCICSRPDGMDKLASMNFKLAHESSALVQDNWWHCRRIFQMLQQRTPLKDTEYYRFEFDLMLTLAAIRSMSDPIPWLLTLDGLLRRISAAYLSPVRGEGREQGIQGRLMEELILFAHGTSTAAIGVRFRFMMNHKALPPSRNLVRWYSMIHKLSPDCANPHCQRLLPSPASVHGLISGTSMREIKSSNFSLNALYSVSARESRLGYPIIRSFISTNRNFGYHCLQSWTQFREAHPTLVAAFFWYSELCHHDGCKAARGKWPTNF